MNANQKFIELMKAALATYPDLRIGQLLVNIVGKSDSLDDLFYLEDETLNELIKQYLKKG